MEITKECFRFNRISDLEILESCFEQLEAYFRYHEYLRTFLLTFYFLMTDEICVAICRWKLFTYLLHQPGTSRAFRVYDK